MKRRLILSLSVILAVSAASIAGTARANEDETNAACQSDQAAARRSSFLGVEIDEVSSDTVRRLKLGKERGALITRVISETSAAKAGLQKDDVVVRWDDKPVESSAEMSRHIRETPAGRQARLAVIRDGREMNVDVTMGERPDFTGRLSLERVRERTERARERAERMTREQVDRARERTERAAERATRAVRFRATDRVRLGVQLQSMSPQLAEYFGLSGRNGALVVFVSSDSPAAKAGIRAGDVILSVAGEKTEGPGEVRIALGSKPEGPVEVTVMRDKQQRSFTVQLGKDSSTSWMIAPEDFGDIIIPMPKIVINPLPALAKIPRISLPRISLAPIRISLPVIAPVRIPKLTMPRLLIPKITIPPIRVPLSVRALPKVV